MELKKWWQASHWPVIWGIGILALALGYIGFKKHFFALGEARSSLSIFYITLQLFVLESGSISGYVPWQLELARWLAPAVAAYTAAMALAKIFNEQLQLLRMHLIRGHVVICGLGRKGLLLAQTFHQRGFRVVVIENEEGNDYLERCREQGAIVFLGDATDREMLRKARVDKARYLISVCSDDGANVEVAAHARELVKNRKRGALTCLVHIVELQLCNLLREHELVTQSLDPFRLEFFNVFESGARALLNEHPFLNQTDPGRHGEAHVLVVGLGRMGESLVIRAARDWRPTFLATGKRLRITVIDREAERKAASLCLRYPALSKVCDIVARPMDVFSPEFQEARFMFDADGRGQVTIVYVCMDGDSRGLSIALALNRQIKGRSLPIVVRMTQDAGLARCCKKRTAAKAASTTCMRSGCSRELATRTCCLEASMRFLPLPFTKITFAIRKSSARRLVSTPPWCHGRNCRKA
jgi:hypothetical protein